MPSTRLAVRFLVLSGLAATLAIAQSQRQLRIVSGPIAKAPVSVRNWKNPYEQQPAAIKAGEKLFRQHCAQCHGEDARGMGKAAALRSAPVQNATSGELVWFLRGGNPAKGMPSWSGLPLQRRWQIVTFLKSLPPAVRAQELPVHSEVTAHSSDDAAGSTGDSLLLGAPNRTCGGLVKME